MGYNYLTKPAKMEKKHWGECQHIHKISKGGITLILIIGGYTRTWICGLSIYLFPNGRSTVLLGEEN